MFNTVALHRPPARIELITDQVRAHRAQMAELEQSHLAALQAAKEEFYRKGKADAGKAFAQEKAELGAVLKALTESMHSADAAIHRDLEAALPGLVIDAVQRILTAWKPDAEAVRAMVRDILHEVPGNNPRLVLLLNAEDFALIKEACDDLHFGEAKVEFITDATLKRGECMVRGKFGTRDARHATKLHKLAELLQ